MPNKTSIEWTDYTSNPIYAINTATGKRGHHCVHVNTLCVHCYAESLNLRWGTGLRFIAQNSDKVHFALSLKELDELSRLDARLQKKGETARVFMFDMTDIGLKIIPRHFLFEVLDRIATFRALTVQLLTKRSHELLGSLKEYCAARGDMDPKKFKAIFKHVHMGASVGDQKTADAEIPILLRLSAYFEVIWLSVEPLLGSIDLSQAHPCGYYCDPGEDGGGHHDHDFWTPQINTTVKWVVVGGESGSGARPTHPKWVRSLRDQCVDAGVKFFFKQWGAYLPAEDAMKLNLNGAHEYVSAHEGCQGLSQLMVRVGKKAAGRLLDGRTWDEMPEVPAQ